MPAMAWRLLLEAVVDAASSASFRVALLRDVAFTMSLVIGMLAFASDPALQEEVKLGILGGSLLAGLGGRTVLGTVPIVARTRASARAAEAWPLR
jgi:NhaA family Na+:H+ antiporter